MADRATLALASLATTPLLLGGFAPFTAATTGVMVAVAAAHLPAQAESPTRTLPRLVVCALAAAAIALLQLVPLPAALTAWLAPGAAALDLELGRAGAAALSHDPAATRSAALSLLLAALLLPVATAAATRVEARRFLLAAVVASAAIVAALGIVETFVGRPLLHLNLPPHARPFGPFANRNHAAALLVVALPIAVGLARDLERAGRRRHAAFALLAASVLLLGLILNGSRGGLLALLLLLALTALRAPVKLPTKLAAFALCAGAVAIPGAAWARRLDLTTLGERVTLARDALAMAADAPLTGIGVGAFAAAYPPCQTVAKDLRFHHVESEPIEFLVEGGVPLLLVALAAGALLVGAAVHVLRRPALAAASSASDVGAALALLALLAHACCDFPLRVPGVVVPALLVTGALLAAGNER